MRYHATTTWPPPTSTNPAAGPAASTGADTGAVPAVLFHRPSATEAVKAPTAGAAILGRVRRAGLTPTTPAWDLLNIALSVMIADAHSRRSASPDGWTRDFDLTIPVADPDLWATQAGALTDALSFLTTDRWSLSFEKGSTPYTAPKEKKQVVPDADCVAMLSGGLDSLVGAIDLVADGHKPFFVSQAVPGDGRKQREFAAAIAPISPALVLNHNVNTHRAPKEPSQRGRSLIFIAYGVLAATTLQPHRDGGSVTLYLNENGYISINPALTPMRLGSLSTRTAHPRYLEGIQGVLDATGLNVAISNPYAFKTKGEMLSGCADKTMLANLASTSTSCGRFRRYKYQHCGRCLPCQVRRAAFKKAGQTDHTTYKYADLTKSDADHAGFDDVRAVAMATATVQARGFDRWLGRALASVPSADRADTRAMLERGLKELAELQPGLGYK